MVTITWSQIVLKVRVLLDLVRQYFAILEFRDHVVLRAVAPAAVALGGLWFIPSLLNKSRPCTAPPYPPGFVELDEAAALVEVLPDPLSAAVRVESFLVGLLRGGRVLCLRLVQRAQLSSCLSTYSVGPVILERRTAHAGLLKQLFSYAHFCYAPHMLAVEISVPPLFALKSFRHPGRSGESRSNLSTR